MKGGKKLSQMLKSVQTLTAIESALNKLYHGEQETSSLLRTCNKRLPKIERIAHDGELRILAFSDYRVQRIGELLHLLRHLEEKPDLIVYAGDAVNRFAPLRGEQLYFKFSDDREIERVWAIDDQGFSVPLPSLILRLPKVGADESAARNKILEIIRFIDSLYSELNRGRTLSEKSLKELLTKYPMFQLRRKGSKVEETDIVDSRTGMVIMSLYQVTLEGYALSSDYLNSYNLIKDSDPSSIAIRKIGEDHDYAYFYISVSEPDRNMFEELASYAKNGLVAIIGDSDSEIDRSRIRGKNVYEIHNTWINIGPLLIVGFEGSTYRLGPSGYYSEGSVRLRLELAREFSKNEGLKLLIVSHSPPREVLDRVMRFGDRAAGSLALRDFLEESNNVTLVICGHVYECGGMYEKVGNTTIVNVSSYDSPFSKANIAWVVLDRDGEIKEVKWMKLPSLLETILKRGSKEEKLIRLNKEVKLSKNEAASFIKAYHKHGDKLLEDLQELANMKHRYGFSWNNVLKLYDYGVKTPESITKAVYEKVFAESYGIERFHLKRAYNKVLREREKGSIYLINPIPIPDDSKVVIFDTEYTISVGVLYGFLDMSSGELKQFWFDEKPKAQEYLRTKFDKVFIHWGGLDRSLLRRELNYDVPTINLLYFVQTSLVAPISSTELREVHDVLCGRLESEFWKRSFYEKNGISKLVLCNRVLRDPLDKEAREELAAANKADILALQHIVEKIKQLNRASLHLHRIVEHESIKEVKEVSYPIVSQATFDSIIENIEGKQKRKLKDHNQ